MTTKHLPAHLEIRATGDEPEIVITTPARDLMHDTIDPVGMDCASYLAGPRAVNFAHDHARLPIGKTEYLAQSAQGIRARFRWLDEANPEARAVRAVFEEGVLGASVEFVPVETEPTRDGGVHFARTILTGWALTGNPANPQCVRMMKSLGWGVGLDDEIIDLDAIPAEDGIDLVTVSRADVVGALREAIREQTASAVTAAVARARWTLVPPSAEVIELDDEDVLRHLDSADVRAALREALPAMVRESLPAARARARGRID